MRIEIPKRTTTIARHLPSVAALLVAIVANSRCLAGDGPVWDATPGQPGMNDGINVLFAADESSPTGPVLMAGGAFTSAGGSGIASLARWDGRDWQTIGEGPPLSEVLSLITFQGDLFAAGFISLPGLARWDGRDWSLVSDAPPSWLGALGVFDAGEGTELYVSGGFLFEASDGLTQYIARWDGTVWFTAGDLASVVHQMLVWDDGGGPALYGAGTMGIMLEGGGFCVGAGRWEGLRWSPLGSCLAGFGDALAVFDDGSGEALYFGGSFSSAGGEPALNIAKWDGSSWSPVGSGLNAEVFALAVFDDGSGPALYAGGAFTEAGGVPALHVARWDGSSWSAVGEGANDVVTAMTAIDEETGGPALAVGGDFTMVDGETANRIAFLRPASPRVPGDVDGDGLVGISDFLSLLAAWGECPDPPSDCPADFDGDDEVGITDLLLLLANWS